MFKNLFSCFLVLFSSNLLAAALEEELKPKPRTSITLDYIAAENDLYGITLAPSHYDSNYANWGYYIGYAQSKKEDIEIEDPAEAYTQEILWRFGLSYSLTANLSLYGGASTYTNEYAYTNSISPRIVDGKPRWETDKDTTWGADIGLRYILGKHFTLGAGYNSATDSAVLSLGYTM